MSVFGTDTQPQESFVKKLVEQRGDTWSDPEVIAKGKLEADEHISNLETQLAEMKSELDKQDYSKDLLEQIQKQQATGSTPPANGSQSLGGANNTDNTSPTLSEDELRSLVDKALTERTSLDKATANLERVNSHMEDAYGTDAPAKIEERANALGMTKDKLKELAAESPDAFFNLMGETPKKDTSSTSQGTINTSAVATQTPNKRNFQYYQELRRSDRGKYFSPEIQRQMFADRKEMGEGFYS